MEGKLKIFYKRKKKLLSNSRWSSSYFLPYGNILSNTSTNNNNIINEDIDKEYIEDIFEEKGKDSFKFDFDKIKKVFKMIFQIF